MPASLGAWRDGPTAGTTANRAIIASPPRSLESVCWAKALARASVPRSVRFLEAAVDGAGKTQSTILEIR